MKKILTLSAVLSAFSWGYIPGDMRYVSLDGANGLFGNAAGISSIDTKGALLDYQYDDNTTSFRVGGNIENWGASFEYIMGPNEFNEARWNLVQGFDLFNRTVFWGNKISALRSSEFQGTEWMYSPGLLIRPLNQISIGYSIDNLLYLGPTSMERIHNLGATFRLNSLLALSYNWEDFDGHSLLVELQLYGTRFGLQIPVYGGDREWNLTLSTAIGGYTDASIRFYSDFLPKGGSFAFHSARNPRAAVFPSIIRVPLNREVLESDEKIPFFHSQKLGILKIRNLFAHLQKDPSCGLVILDFSGYRGDIGISSEISKLVRDFKHKGGKVVAYLDDVRPSVLLAASTANRIVVEPSAHFSWRGLGGNITFYKGLFDKLGVKVEFLRHGKYKSAVEPYMNDSLSKEARENMETLYSELWESLTQTIITNRSGWKSKQNRIQNALDSLVQVPVVTAKTAVKTSVVDTSLYIDQVPSYMLKTFFDYDVPMADYKTWAPTDKKIFEENWNPRKKIAFLNIDGAIDARMERNVLDALHKIPYSGVSALVVRISSPGGSASASEKIWAAIKNLKRDSIPVIASIGSVGASGAYYIACGADIILAEPFSIVGSIGIYGGKIDASGLLSKMGMKSEAVKTHPYADATSFARPWSKEEKAALQEYMDDFYDRFVSAVSKATKIKKDIVDTLYGEGRVMTGKSALQAGLVQKLGGINDAIEEAKKRANISERTSIELIQISTGKSYITSNVTVKGALEFVDYLEQTKFWAIEPSLLNVE